MQSPAPESPVAGRVSELVEALLTQRGLGAVTASQDLRDAGLKSMDAFNLMLAVEGAFDIMIPDREMTLANFRCIPAIRTLVALV